MATETEDKVTSANNDGQHDDTAESKGSDGESYTKIRIKRALDKAAPKLAAEGRRSLLAELGVDPEDEGAIDSLKAVLAKGSTADTERTKLQKELAKLAGEREAAVARAADLERHITTRTIRDTIAEAIGDAAIVPGTLGEIQTLLSGRFAVADGKPVVVGDDGEPVNVAPKKLVGEWLASHTHYLTATAPKGGAGSRSSSGEARSSNGKQKLRTDEERKAFFEQKLREGPPRS
jgi:hypothetical protein